MKKVKKDKIIEYWTKLINGHLPLDPTWQVERIVKMIVEDTIKKEKRR